MIEMTETEFGLLRELILSHTGIDLHESKRTLLANRLRGQLRAHSMTTFSDYLDHVRFGGASAAAELADAVTTRTTEFFRFPPHFRLLGQRALPELARRGGRRPPVLWSAGCATGEEACSIAMTVHESLPQSVAARAEIRASDLSPRAIAAAVGGVYPAKRASRLDRELRLKYLDEAGEGFVKVKAHLARCIRYRVENLRDAGRLAPESVDVVFCRNVLIYFGQLFRHERLAELARALSRGGYLFLGPSEMILEPQALGLDRVGPSTYRKPEGP